LREALTSLPGPEHGRPERIRTPAEPAVVALSALEAVGVLERLRARARRPEAAVAHHVSTAA
jgi:hypothetical protein